ncbi:hypothetical protein BDW22DRAFT_804078 [Trametopsis cervina]|nr:hypothetical protein BDW22DRAFT_804078 [Trametopsis cervina]
MGTTQPEWTLKDIGTGSACLANKCHVQELEGRTHHSGIPWGDPTLGSTARVRPGRTSRGALREGSSATLALWLQFQQGKFTARIRREGVKTLVAATYTILAVTTQSGQSLTIAHERDPVRAGLLVPFSGTLRTGNTLSSLSSVRKRRGRRRRETASFIDVCQHAERERERGPTPVTQCRWAIVCVVHIPVLVLLPTVPLKYALRARSSREGVAETA